VFISHAHSDNGWADRLSSELKSAGIQVWEPSSVLPGADYSREVSKALGRADALVVLVSPAAMGSDYVRNEIRYALGQERFQDRLIPVLVKRTPSEKVPWILRDFEWVKGNPTRAAKEIMTRLRGSRDEARAKTS
jgi:hypothetical protein